MLVKTSTMFANVGSAGTRLDSRISVESVNAPDTIHSSGKSWTKASTVAAPRQSQVPTSGRWRAGRARSVGVVKTASSGDAEGDGGHGQQRECVEGGHGRGVADIVELERLLIDVEDAHGRGVGGPALRHHVDQVE